MTRAAERIGLSQPAMSHALSRLRSLFADDLFVRTPSGMEPTARAREIAPLVAAAIEHIEAALNLGLGFDPAKSTGIFTAGMAEYAEVALVGRLAEAFARQAPRGDPAPDAADRHRCRRAARPRRDRCRGRPSRALPAHIESILLLRDPFVVIARRGHPIAGQYLSIEAYAALNHILVSPRGDTSGALDRILVDFGLRRRIALLVATYLALPVALAASDLVATVPSRTARQIAATAEIADHATADRFLDDRVDGLAPPRRERARAGLVPLAADRSGERLIGFSSRCPLISYNYH